MTDAAGRRPRVLMVTGAYHPETSGASLQCRQLMRALHGRADFALLTTSTDPELPWRSVVDDVEVRRVTVDPHSAVSKAIAVERVSSTVFELQRGVDIIHLHGFSQKSLLLVALARLFNKSIVIKLTSFGHDDPQSIKAHGRAAWLAFRQADRFIGVTPRFGEQFDDAGLDRGRFRFIPNGVDLTRFMPVSENVRAELRRQLGIPASDPVILFVGFFSREKNPDVLFEAWAALHQRGLRSTLVLVGATHGTYYEIDPSLAERIRAGAAERGLSESLVMVEGTDTIEWYYRAADIFALPTAREGLPNVLLEAMATEVPPVITRLEGVTDWIVSPGVTGELVPTIDAASFASAIERLLAAPEQRRAMGQAARAHAAAHFSIDATAQATLDVYHELLPEAAP